MRKYTERKSESRDDSDSDFLGILIIIGIVVSTDLAHGERICTERDMGMLAVCASSYLGNFHLQILPI